MTEVKAASPPVSMSATARLLKPFSLAFSSVFYFILDIFDAIFLPIQNRIGVQRMAYIFVLPNLLIFSIFILLPVLLNFHYSVTGGTRLFPQDRPYVGAENFERLFDCEDFLQPSTCREDNFAIAVANTVFFVLVQVGLLVLMSLITALALNQNIRARGFFRSVFFYPVLLSPVVVALIWKWILQQDGLLNALLVNLGGERKPFLLNADWAEFWVVIISVWSQMGFYTLILLAGLQSIPSDMYEAASIDGSNQYQAFRFITMPLLMPTMLVVLVLSLIRAVQVFDVVFAFTGGGPGRATMYMVQYIYSNGFANQTRQFGMAAAASVVLAVALMLLTLVQLRLGRSSDVAST